ncbi:hypothetical protein LX36DRAFT_269566 [Colletotrichum falcatum]|nr:hypothetical protein LX36DRAFT_269566 [Colletotrichum falcatum]
MDDGVRMDTVGSTNGHARAKLGGVWLGTRMQPPDQAARCRLSRFCHDTVGSDVCVLVLALVLVTPKTRPTRGRRDPQGFFCHECIRVCCEIGEWMQALVSADAQRWHGINSLLSRRSSLLPIR